MLDINTSDPEVEEEDRLVIGKGNVSLATVAGGAGGGGGTAGGGTHIRLQSNTSMSFRFCQMRYRHTQC